MLNPYSFFRNIRLINLPRIPNQLNNSILGSFYHYNFFKFDKRLQHRAYLDSDMDKLVSV